MHPQPNPRATWASGDDNGGFFLIVILACICVLAYLLWSNYHAEISAAVMALHHAEIAVVRHFTGRFDLADRQMARAYPDDVTLRDLYGISHAVGGFFRIPAALLILALAAVCMVRAAPSRYKRAFDVDGLVREQAASFGVTAAFVGRHLQLVAPSSAPRHADYALTPEEWIAHHATGRDGALDEARARQEMVSQLGPRWAGVRHASPQVRVMLAVLALHRDERRAEALHLLGELSASLGGGSPGAGSPGAGRPGPGRPGVQEDDPPEGPASALVFSNQAVARADALLRDPALLEPALAVMRMHAYTHPALMALLNEARQKAGVMAPAQFAWLKLVDRPLWYALHSLGFETEGYGRYLHPNPRVEAIGARDQWAAERVAGEPLPEPELDRAMDALRKVVATRPKPRARRT